MLGVTYDEKHICWLIRFSVIAYLQKAHIIASLENVPDFPFRLSAKISSLFKKYVSSAHIRKIHIIESYLIKYLVKNWYRGKNLQDFCGQYPYKNVELKLPYLLFISKITKL